MRNKLVEAMELLDEEYVEEANPEHAKPMKRIQKKLAVRWISAAACFCVLTGGVLSLSLNNAFMHKVYSADEIACLFETEAMDSADINAYTKLYVPDAKYLYCREIDDNQYLPMYTYNIPQNAAEESKLQKLVDRVVSKLSVSLDAENRGYSIEKNTGAYSVYCGDMFRYAYLPVKSYGEELNTALHIGTYRILGGQDGNEQYIILHNKYGGMDITLDGETVMIDQQQSDSQIINSLSGIKQKLFELFGVRFHDVKVLRSYDSYSQHGAEEVYIYFYNEDAHPLNRFFDAPVSDHIMIRFDNSVNSSGEAVSDSILRNAVIRYVQNRGDISQEYQQSDTVRRIPLEKAEVLLRKGYVFSGHVCKLCMLAQNKIDFADYDFVELTYVFGYPSEAQESIAGIPFYAFYKEIGTSKNGNTVYAKTYVPAVEVSGMDAYFEAQQAKH